MLLRWIAQHLQAPAHLRNRLLPTLPWRALAAIASDASAHPQARAHALERLRSRWPAIWKVRDVGVLAAFLLNPRLSPDALDVLILQRLTLAHAEALQDSRWRQIIPVAVQVLQALDKGLENPENGLVLGLAAPWILALPAEERLNASTGLTHPALRRMVRAWALPRGDGDWDEVIEPAAPRA